jgi:hypothetical protein
MMIWFVRMIIAMNNRGWEYKLTGEEEYLP